MGYSDWSAEAFTRTSRGREAASSREIFRVEQSVDPRMSPRGLTVREARDSEHHPRSVPIIVGFDVTGSMGDVPTRFAQELLGTLMNTLLEGGFVTDPQILIAAYGDAVSDRAPLQVGQFESGLEMDQWLTRLWLEGRGGDIPESTTLVHWFAARHTATDAWEKRGGKGYLFTIGDAPNKPLQASHVQRTFGNRPEGEVSDAVALSEAQARYHTWHILLDRGALKDALPPWRALLGPMCVVLKQVDAICTLIAVLIARQQGLIHEVKARSLLRQAGLSEGEIGPALGA